ncbi:BNR-4 repeat-containing protein [Puniceicoccus vermicola]|uniref:BNR-4 repeat-containing protein n=1 Tax=Puniceicoccus vermicola TaxID=388746 RepID=A0A7X1AXR2_9BACT|nr:BNR-4 repeat-containing protein [Puniceicoccus vermicola]MBC2601817.1 BNR-4 repeat-containing protein [Puniceicoccus vermicola]
MKTIDVSLLWRRWAAPLVLSAIVASPISVSAQSKPTIEVERVDEMSPYNIAAWWSPVAYDAKADQLYVSYLRPGSTKRKDDVIIAQRDSDGNWTMEDTGGKAVFDTGHTQTSLAVDGDGVVHFTYGMHFYPFRYGVALAPQTVEAGFNRKAPGLMLGKGPKFTYPNMATAANGDLYLIIREGLEGRLYHYRLDGKQWEDLGSFAAEKGSTVYPDQIFPDPNGDLHIIWEWAEGGPQATRHMGSYARYEPNTGKYFRADGSEYTELPITREAADLYQPLEGEEVYKRGVHGIQSAKMALDENGMPLIAYAYSTNQKHHGYEHRLAKWDGSQWVRETVASGPFSNEKPWISYFDGQIHYYTFPGVGNGGDSELALLMSSDAGASWSVPIVIIDDLKIARPVGTSFEGTDFLYLPTAHSDELYLGMVQFD